MHENALSIFNAWSNFYVITGSSAAALTGLMFVVVTLIAGRTELANAAHDGFAVFSTPTVVHFCAALIISGILTAPWPSVAYAGATIGIAGLCGVGYIVRITLRTMHQTAYKPDLGDWIWFTILPLLAYATIAATALLLVSVPTVALFVLASATMTLILIGIHNAWDIVTYIAIENPNLMQK